jgi:hypothetical protein
LGVRKEGSGKEAKCERVRRKWVRKRAELRAEGKRRCVESRLDIEKM